MTRSSTGTLCEDALLGLLVEVLEHVEGVVAVELAEGLRHLLRPERVEHLLAHVLVEVGEGLRLDLLLGEGEELLALFRAQLLQQVGDVGGVQALHQLAHDMALVRLQGVARGLHRLRRHAVGDVFFLAIAGGVGQVVGPQVASRR